MKNPLYKLVWTSLVLALTFAWLIPAVPVSANNYAPNTTAINETYAWRNVLETGDFLLVAHYKVTYTSLIVNGTQVFQPATDINDTFIFRLMDATNTNELGVVEAYPYQNQGYGDGIISWYFPAASAPAWAGSYWIRIEGKLTAFTSPPIYNYNLPASTYSSLTTTSAIQSDIATKLLNLAWKVGNLWSPAQNLTEPSQSGTELSILGEAYMRPVIPGIQAMAPAMFLLQVGNPDLTDTVWSTNQSDTAAGLVQNTTLGAGIQGWAGLFNMSFSAIAAIPIIIFCVLNLIVGASQGNMLSGVINSAVVLDAATLFGWFPMGILMLISFFCGVYILYHLIFKNG